MYPGKIYICNPVLRKLAQCRGNDCFGLGGIQSFVIVNTAAKGFYLV